MRGSGLRDNVFFSGFLYTSGEVRSGDIYYGLVTGCRRDSEDGTAHRIRDKTSGTTDRNDGPLINQDPLGVDHTYIPSRNATRL